MFTSFGYFDEDDENAAVLREICRIVRWGGWFFLDYLNPVRTLEKLVEDGEKRLGNITFREKRRYDPDTGVLTKQVVIENSGGSVEDSWEERLRLYTESELERMLSATGLQPVARFGDYSGETYGAGSPRLLFFCRRLPVSAEIKGS